MKKRLLITIIFVFISAINVIASERVITLDFETNEVTSLPALPELSAPVLSDVIGDSLTFTPVLIKNYIYGGLTNANNVGVIAKSNKLYKDPAIVMDPLVGHGKVFWTGESTMRVWGISQWYSFSGLVFNFDKDLTTLAVNFSYLNDRAACGKVNIIIQKVDGTGKVLWENAWNVTGWQQGNYTWRSYALAKSRFTSRIAGRSFNRVMLIEADLQWDSYKGLVGSGYLDDIIIRGDTLVPDVEPVVEVPPVQELIVPEVIAPVVEKEVTEPTILINKTFVVDAQRTLSVTCLDKDATYNHELYAEINGSSIFVFNSKKKGKTVNLGKFPVGTVVNFKLKVTTTGYSYYTGKKSNNPDGMNHSMITGFGNSWIFGFEDFLNGGDQDYNDCLFQVDGVTVVEGTTEI